MKEACLAARGFGKERGWDAPTKSAACPASHLRGVGILYPQDLVWGGPSPPFTQTHGLVVLPPPPARPSRTPACQRGVPGLWGRVQVVWEGQPQRAAHTAHHLGVSCKGRSS